MVGVSTLLVYILAALVSSIDAKGTKPEERIVGGEEVSFSNEFPHHIQLIQRLSETTGFICGGSLIHEQWVLTAAHCVTDKPGANGLDAFIITAGRLYGPSSNIILADAQRNTAQRIFIHPCFLGLEIDPRVNNDIALIKVANPYKLNDDVKIIPLDEINMATNGTKTQAIGWGISNPMTMEFPDILKKVTLFLPQDGICEELVRFIDVRSQICLNETDSVCSGDSGGPLLCNDGGKNYVCGISSFVKDLQCTGGFNVFVRVFHFKDWIKEVMENERESQADCVTPQITFTTTKRPTRPTRPMTTTENIQVPLEIVNNSTSRAGLTLYEQNGFYISTILVSFIFTY